MDSSVEIQAQVEARLAASRMRRRQRARARLIRRSIAGGVALLVAGLLVTAFVYGGSADHIAGGIRIAGIDVGGKSVDDAQRTLALKVRELSGRPLVVRVGDKTIRILARDIHARVDVKKAVALARERGDGFFGVRGFRRISLSLSGEDITPPLHYDRARLQALLERAARRIDVSPTDSTLVLTGLNVAVTPEKSGVSIDYTAATRAITASFRTFRRDPVRVAPRVARPKVTRVMWARRAAQLRTLVSAPVRLSLGKTTYRLPRWRLAKMAVVPESPSDAIVLRGKETDRYFLRLQKTINRPPSDATWVVNGSGAVVLVADKPGLALDVPRTADDILEAALRPAAPGKDPRVASIVVGESRAERTTADARTYGIRELVSSYTTVYGGDPNRIHNVQLVARLIDNTLIPPGQTFSFNGTTGERNAAKGFLDAPVIINGELQSGLGGGVCQVSTTVFNAAYTAGLNITARTNHALYISHYPQGRDATVNYPDTDLRFVNDTDHWLLLRTFVGSSSLTVNLYGTNPHRRVESSTSPLRDAGPPPTEKIDDPSLLKGKQVVEEPGSRALATSVHRLVYDADGKLLYDNTWTSSYRGEKRVVRVGTKPKPKKQKKPRPTDPTTLPTDPTSTDPAATTPAETTPTGPAVDAPVDPTTTDPATTDPTTTDPAATDPAGTDPAAPPA